MGDRVQNQIPVFREIRVLNDYGCFEWNPHLEVEDGNEKKMSAEAIRGRIAVPPRPPQLAPIDVLRAKINALGGTNNTLTQRGRGHALGHQRRPGILFDHNLPQDIKKTDFPYECPRLVPLYEAERRGLKLEQVDFLIGGSFLNACARPDCFVPSKDAATARFENEMFRRTRDYLVQNCKSVFVINRQVDYDEMRNMPAYQFKRWACGRNFGDKHGDREFEHLRLLQVGEFKVLVSGSIDAVEERQKGRETPVKIRMRPITEDSRLELLLQLVSCGASALVNGRKDFGRLVQVERHGFQKVCQMVLDDRGQMAELRELEKNICRVLRELKNLDLEEDRTYRISRSRAQAPLQVEALAETSRQRLLPPRRVIEDLWLGPQSLPDALRRLFEGMGALRSIAGIKEVLTKSVTFKRQESERESQRRERRSRSQSPDRRSRTSSGENETALQPPDSDESVTDDADEFLSVYDVASSVTRSHVTGRSAETQQTGSSLGITLVPPSRFRQEQIRNLIDWIGSPGLHDLAMKSDVHWHRIHMHDGLFQKWPEKLPPPLQELVRMQNGRRIAKGERPYYDSSFLGFLHFVRNNIVHLEQDDRDQQLQSALKFLEDIARRDRRDMNNRSKAYQSAFLESLMAVGSFPQLWQIVWDVREECNFWTATLKADVIESLQLDDYGRSYIHRLFDANRTREIIDLVKNHERDLATSRFQSTTAERQSLTPYHFLWRATDGKSPLDIAENWAADPPHAATDWSVRDFQVVQDFVLQSGGKELFDSPLAYRWSLLHKAVDQQDLDRVRFLVQRVKICKQWRDPVRHWTVSEMVIFNRKEMTQSQWAATVGASTSRRAPAPADIEDACDNDETNSQNVGDVDDVTKQKNSLARMDEICRFLGVDPEEEAGFDAAVPTFGLMESSDDSGLGNASGSDDLEVLDVSDVDVGAAMEHTSDTE